MIEGTSCMITVKWTLDVELIVSVIMIEGTISFSII